MPKGDPTLSFAAAVRSYARRPLQRSLNDKGTYKCLLKSQLGNMLEQLRIIVTPDELQAMKRVATVFPFKTNPHNLELIELSLQRMPERPRALTEFLKTPLARTIFPLPELMRPEEHRIIEEALGRNDILHLDAVKTKIRRSRNPHSSLQRINSPFLHPDTDEVIQEDTLLSGMQHKYRDTALVFPRQGQTCHSYCATFCFRWAQFVGMDLFSQRDAKSMGDYLKQHPEVKEILFTGGDPATMKANHWKPFLDMLKEIPSIEGIRIGTKSLTYWPQRWTTDPDAAELLAQLSAFKATGRYVALMAHINHGDELLHPKTHQAIETLLQHGIIIRTQSPIIQGINDHPDIWARKWKTEVALGLVPYYLFVARDTLTREVTEVPLARTFEIYTQAQQQVQGLAQTARGPSMSSSPGKIRIVGIPEINGEKVFALEFLQARNPEWKGQLFFAKFDPKATWLDDLRPALTPNGKWFWENEYHQIVTTRQTKLDDYLRQRALAAANAIPTHT